jgi:CBS domain-containing membrane protein
MPHLKKLGCSHLTCADIMTQDIVTIQPKTALEEAWSLLRYHKIKALPVLDPQRRVVGVVTIADFLKQFDNRNLPTLGHRLRAMLRCAPGSLQSVGAIMTSPVIMVPGHMPVVDLVSRLSDEGLHHLPIVDERQQLCGMVTQSDLIAALYHQLVLKVEPVQ